jgi:putative ABC transport system ATP-binding protein
MTLINARNLVKTYRTGEVEVLAVRGVDFTIEAKSFVAFVGPSGSGKSTLLNMIGCLDHPTSGKLTVMDTDVSTRDRRHAANFRGQHIGFVFQDFNLIPVLTVYENIEYQTMVRGGSCLSSRDTRQDSSIRLGELLPKRIFQ